VLGSTSSATPARCAAAQHGERRASFLWSLRVDEIVAFYGRLYGLSGATCARASMR
jgi:hypothetical protein